MYVGDATLRKGRNVLVPYCLLHRDESIWGTQTNSTQTDFSRKAI